ncbi:BREX-1 system adenine-specific DNA-methyltransferase PglX [Bacteroides cellulolyticus]|uniref:BREX-1 system adenine-specific DNA-methyltransferase PglX n=1 Tax=Bacteroides cellulolyticus TaxID=2981780 RepID=UPI0012AB8A82|nr:BREX-1 system adenine-specific DNA-methyltransferase PglX [Bacteroides cellulolyticus]MCU6771279.1 BREX-1 system adenine-specific DNA-methyltransferase PglX [Bacteroides cellulolyticus]
MATNTSALKTFAQQTRIKLLQLIGTRLEFVLTQDTAELRGYEAQITKLKERIDVKGKDGVIEEVAYTWFNRVMALRFMDANGYNSPMVVTPAPGQMRPEILQDAMSGAVDEELNIKKEELLLPEAVLYRRLLVAKCNVLGETMPFLFEHISDYTELLLPENLLSDQSFVTDIRNGMTDDDCLNVEVMGWLYQFYITDRKADAEAKKSRKGGLKSDEQAAATQLFTPHWVVRYMVENSLGRIWMTLHPESRLKEDMPYYIPTPAGQTDSIPEGINSVSDITFIDPCMGSGHVLVYAFDLFCKMYEEEGYQTREIPSMVLTNNLFGIDIDSRCYQLAAFALTMKARAYHSRYLRKAVVPNVIALQNIDRDTIEAAGNWDKKSGMWQFENVDTIGSLLQIEAEEYDRIKVAGGLFGANLDLLKKQAEFLSRKYHCVVTNPPYLGKGFGIALRDYAAQKYSLTKYDTMVMFMEQCLNMSVPNGFSAMINFQSWMFVYNYTDFRKILIKNSQIHNMLHLGRGIFGADFGSVTFVLQKTIPYKSGNYYCLFDRMSSVRTVTQIESIYLSKKYVLFVTKQLGFLNIPGYNIGYWVSHNMLNSFKQGKSIGTIGTTRKGMYTGLNEKFVRNWKEVSYNNIAFEFDKEQSEINNQMWYPYANGGDFRKWFGNYDDVVLWKHNGKQLRTEKNEAGKLRAGCFNLEYIYKQGIVWSSVTIADTSMRLMCKGSLFSSASNAWFGNNTKYMLGFLNSKVSKSLLKAINPTVNANPGDIGQIPFLQDLCKGDNITKLSEDCITISKLDWDAHETSWDFKENEIIRLQKEGLGEISVRLEDVKVLRYFSLYALVLEYKAFWEEKFYQLHANEEELNRQFIEIYGLQDELTPDVPLDEVTILQKGEISIEDNKLVWHDDIIVKQFISYLVGCFMGRYSIDKPGLIIASQHQDLNEVGLKVEGLDNGAEGRLQIDDDGIIPILDVEYFADDMTVRIEQAVKTIFGEESYQENLSYINNNLGKCKSLREYLFKDFYADHIDGKMYQKRPIYWLFSSKMGDKKKKGYFKALVYMHRLESDTLSKLHADYVVPYIDKIEQQYNEAQDMMMRDDLSQAQRNKARKTADEFMDKIKEVKEFEQQLVQMASQRLGIDLDDGVRVNYPKFYPLVEPIKGLDKEE